MSSHTPAEPETIVFVRSQRYELLRRELHITLTGRMIRGKPFEFRALLSHAPENRRCSEHKAPGREVTRSTVELRSE
jgi:hypothetical protein